MIRFYANTDAFTNNTQLLPANYTEAQWDALCRKQFVRVKAGANADIAADTRALTVSSNFSTTAEDRYNTYMNTKLAAMTYGNAAVGAPTDDYNFEKGYDGAVYRGANGDPYLQTIQHKQPTSYGEIALLSSECVGIDISGNTITLNVDGALCDTCELYTEFNAYAWCLYHFINLQAHRIFDYDPDNRFWGLLVSYQALVAKWNNTVWKNTYRFNAETIREALTFEIGYSCTKCSMGEVTITAVVTLEDGFIPDGYSYPSTNELLMYKMGETQIASDQVKEATTVTIRRYYDSDTDYVTDSGTGNEVVNAYAPSWTKYEVTVVIPSMRQKDSYVGIFSIARGMYADTLRNIPRADQYPDGELPMHTLNMSITWNEENTNILTKTENGIKILALDNIPDDLIESSASSESGTVTPIG